MKVCSRCTNTKPETDFFVKDKASGRLHAQCKECYRNHRKTYAMLHYEKYGDAYRQRAKVRRAQVKRKLLEEFISYMRGKSCTDCGESDMRVLEFDHLDPASKKFGIARAISNGVKWPVIAKEIENCQIVCANCHKKRTAKQFNWFKALNLD